MQKENNFLLDVFHSKNEHFLFWERGVNIQYMQSLKER
jgi:hypothetical protein